MNKIRGSIYAGLGTCIFAVNFVSMKILVDNLPEMSILFLRFTIAWIFLISFLVIKKENPSIEKCDLPSLSVTGFLGMFAYYVLFSFSLKFISASVACLICSLIPIITLFSEGFIKKTRIEFSAVFSLAISSYGVYLVLDKQSSNSSVSSAALGVILMLLAVCAWIAYTFKTHSLLAKYDDMKVLAYQNIFASMMLFPFFAFDLPKIVNSGFETRLLFVVSANVLFVGILASAIGYYLFILGIKHLGVTVSSAYMNIMPAITLATSYFVLGEEITLQKIIGCLFVIAAVFFITFKEEIKCKLLSTSIHKPI